MPLFPSTSLSRRPENTSFRQKSVNGLHLHFSRRCFLSFFYKQNKYNRVTFLLEMKEECSRKEGKRKREKKKKKEKAEWSVNKHNFFFSAF
jgi:hypothetical protein